MTASKILVDFKCEECGKNSSRHKRSDSKFRYCSVRCGAVSIIRKMNKRDRTREKNPSWKGGVRYAGGYRFILYPKNQEVYKTGYRQEHRLVMEQHLGRSLNKSERIHHLNGERLDNRLENLQLLSGQSEHIKLHISNGSLSVCYWKGKKMSKKTRIKMSATHKKIWQNRKLAV